MRKGRELREAGSADASGEAQGDRGVDGARAAHVCRREAVGRAAPRLGVDRRTPGPRRLRRLAKPRTRVAAETRAKDTSTKRTARSRSGPARTPWTDPGHVPESPASPTGLPVGDDAALWCASSLSVERRRRNPKHQASRRSRQPPDHGDTVGPPRRYPSRSTAA